MDQCASVYTLVKFLRRLRVIGNLQAHTVRCEPDVQAIGNFDFIDMTGADYAIVKDGYSSSRLLMDQEELLENMFGRILGPTYRGTL